MPRAQVASATQVTRLRVPADPRADLTTGLLLPSLSEPVQHMSSHRYAAAHRPEYPVAATLRR